MRTLLDEQPNRIEALRRALPALDERSRSFALDLITKSSDRRYGLSDKQWYWVDQLIERAAQGPREPVKVEVGIAPVVALLDRAAERLKHPAIMVRVNGRNLRLSIAGPTAQVPGSINVCSAATFEDREWFGRIHKSGHFEPSRKHSAETAAAIVVALQALAADPAGSAAEFGRLTGFCCMCGRPLCDARSTAAGFGPQCARIWGLDYPSAGKARAARQPELAMVGVGRAA